MSACRFVVKALVLAFFALNAYNRFTSAATASQQFKADYTQFVGTIQNKLSVTLPAQLQASFITGYSYEIVYYGAIAQLVFSVLGLFCGLSSAAAGLIYFVRQFILLNYLNVNFKSTTDLEKYALPVSLFMAALCVSCCGSCKTKCALPNDKKKRD